MREGCRGLSSRRTGRYTGNPRFSSGKSHGTPSPASETLIPIVSSAMHRLTLSLGGIVNALASFDSSTLEFNSLVTRGIIVANRDGTLSVRKIVSHKLGRVADPDARGGKNGMIRIREQRLRGVFE